MGLPIVVVCGWEWVEFVLNRGPVGSIHIAPVLSAASVHEYLAKDTGGCVCMNNPNA